MRLVLIHLFWFCLVSVYAQGIRLSPETEISVLTIGPGKSLNDAFGHNAFRIIDPVRGWDWVYGYGEYDFDAPNFYLKFAQGKLNYLISKHRFSDIYRHYSRANRTIEEQVLNFSQEEKQNLFNYLEENYKPENRRYLYDFFYDNCATKIRDIAELTTNGSIEYSNPKNFKIRTFRELIYEHVDRNSWGSLGIDLGLGSVVDRKASPREFMFLPKYIHSFFENATIDNKNKLIRTSRILYEKKDEELDISFLASPLLLISILAALILYITYRDYKNTRVSSWLDISIAVTTSLIGIILFLLWFATDHSATAYNYNLLWAFPLNFLLIGQLAKSQKSNWVKGYLKFLLLMLILLTLHWSIGVQLFAISLIPLLIALVIRYFYLLKTLK